MKKTEKIEPVEVKLSLLQKELRDKIITLMQVYSEEKMPLDCRKEPVIIWYYDDYSAGYFKGTVSAVIYRNETLYLEIDGENGETLELDENLGDLAFDIPVWMLAIYRKMQINKI